MFCCDSALLNVWLGVAVVIPENTYFFFPQTKPETPKYLLYAAKQPQNVPTASNIAPSWSNSGLPKAAVAQRHHNPTADPSTSLTRILDGVFMYSGTALPNSEYCAFSIKNRPENDVSRDLTVYSRLPFIPVNQPLSPPFSVFNIN